MLPTGAPSDLPRAGEVYTGVMSMGLSVSRGVEEVERRGTLEAPGSK